MVIVCCLLCVVGCVLFVIVAWLSWLRVGLCSLCVVDGWCLSLLMSVVVVQCCRSGPVCCLFACCRCLLLLCCRCVVVGAGCCYYLMSLFVEFGIDWC